MLGNKTMLEMEKLAFCCCLNVWLGSDVMTRNEYLSHLKKYPLGPPHLLVLIEDEGVIVRILRGRI